MANQIEFVSILEDSFRAHERKIKRYIGDNAEAYRVKAFTIAPCLHEPEQIFSRIAFAILSANSPFEDSVKALNYVLQTKGYSSEADIAQFKMVPAKAKYVNDLWNKGELFQWRKDESETWASYRLRLQKGIKGLGLAKASFAACLLYPLDADLACIDTWIQKVFLGHNGFKSLSLKTYLIVEAKIRSYARQFSINTFLAQWLIWDHARGNQTNHDIFPGSHKEVF